MRIFGNFFISALIYLLLFLPTVSWAEDKGTAFIEISANIFSNGDFSSNAKKTILKKKPEAKNIEDNDHTGVAIRILAGGTLSAFNMRMNAAIDIGGSPTLDFTAKQYPWSDYHYSSQKFGNGLILRILLTADYFIIGNASDNTGLAFSTGFGYGGLLDAQLGEDEYTDTVSYDGTSYEYGLKLVFPIADNTNISLSLMKAQVLHSSEFSWKSNMITLGLNGRF